MAVTATKVYNPGDYSKAAYGVKYFRILVLVNLDEYATGGVALRNVDLTPVTPINTALAGATIKNVLRINTPNGGGTEDGVYTARWDDANHKMLLYTRAGAEGGSSIHVEVTNGADVSAAGKDILCEILAEFDNA